LTIAKTIIEKAEQALYFISTDDIILQIKIDQILKYVGYAEKFIDQINRRVIDGETIPHAEKVFSIFEKYTGSVPFNPVNYTHTRQPVVISFIRNSEILFWDLKRPEDTDFTAVHFLAFFQSLIKPFFLYKVPDFAFYDFIASGIPLVDRAVVYPGGFIIALSCLKIPFSSYILSIYCK
jgi:hypothetical protein